ncbi:MAG: hypothetical protein HZA36_02000 [Parcubacteria group bacterium]|nr:hypothetical protein [Parcubacteria group bacterium]
MKYESKRFLTGLPPKGRGSLKKSGGITKTLVALFLLGFFIFQITPIVLASSDGGFWGIGKNIGKVELHSPFPGVRGGEPIKTVNAKSLSDFEEFLTYVFKFLFGLAAVIAVMQIAIGGLQYMAAGASIGSVQQGQKRIYDAVTGLVLLLVSILILRTINPDITGKGLKALWPDLPYIAPPVVDKNEGTAALEQGKKQRQEDLGNTKDENTKKVNDIVNDSTLTNEQKRTNLQACIDEAGPKITAAQDKLTQTQAELATLQKIKTTYWPHQNGTYLWSCNEHKEDFDFLNNHGVPVAFERTIPAWLLVSGGCTPGQWWYYWFDSIQLGQAETKLQLNVRDANIAFKKIQDEQIKCREGLKKVPTQ